MQKRPIGHAKLGSAKNFGTLQLKENDGDGLIHTGRHQFVLFRVFAGIAGELYVETAEITVLVHFIGKYGKRPQGNTVTGFNHVQIVVADGVAEHCGYQSTGTGSCAHPQNIVVAPLNIHAVAVHQGIHYNIRTGTTVENVAYNVQMVAGQRFDHIAKCLNHITCLTDLNDAVNKIFKLDALRTVLVTHMDQFVNDLLIALGQKGANFIAGVLDGNIAA